MADHGMSRNPPVFCAIDRPDLDGAVALVRALEGTVGGVKLGLEFATANGPEGIRAIAALGFPVVLDLKLHDIPQTVAGAVRATAGLGAAMLTVHAAGGRGMLRAALDAAGAAARPLQLLGVTVLTSLGDDDLRETGIRGSTIDQALRLADLAVECGFQGLVCSPIELDAMRQRFGSAITLVVPGVRPSGVAAGDQKRTMTPAEAIAHGADRLVVGRAITQAPDPRAAALAIAREIETARAAPGSARSAARGQA